MWMVLHVILSPMLMFCVNPSRDTFYVIAKLVYSDELDKDNDKLNSVFQCKETQDNQLMLVWNKEMQHFECLLHVRFDGMKCKDKAHKGKKFCIALRAYNENGVCIAGPEHSEAIKIKTKKRAPKDSGKTTLDMHQAKYMQRVTTKQRIRKRTLDEFKQDNEPECPDSKRQCSCVELARVRSDLDFLKK